MLYLNKFLLGIKRNPRIFKADDIVISLGLTNTQIKNLKKYALENQLITQLKQEYFLTENGEKYLEENPIKSWADEFFSLRPNVNVELLKEEKFVPNMTKAIRNLARNMLENQELKEFSLEKALLLDLKVCKNLSKEIENKILDGRRNSLLKIFENLQKKGITKPLFYLNLLKIISDNLERIAIYEKSQFQLKFDVLMFDRMVACPQNFEFQITEMADEYLLKDISKIILNSKNENILEITKGLYKIIKSLDKYTMNTQNLNTKTLRLRNVILNAKDPISLFKRDIPKTLVGKELCDCDRDFLNNLKLSLNELKNCTKNLVKDLKEFIYKSFKTTSKEELAERFLSVAEYISDKELKILFNNVVEKDVDEDLWTNRIATFINKFRVPKDWSDEDYAEFKLKTKELALKFFVLESTLGTSDCMASKKYKSVLDSYLKLSKQEQMILLRTAIKT